MKYIPHIAFIVHMPETKINKTSNNYVIIVMKVENNYKINYCLYRILKVSIGCRIPTSEPGYQSHSNW